MKKLSLMLTHHPLRAICDEISAKYDLDILKAFYVAKEVFKEHYNIGSNN